MSSLDIESLCLQLRNGGSTTSQCISLCFTWNTNIFGILSIYFLLLVSDRLTYIFCNKPLSKLSMRLLVLCLVDTGVKVSITSLARRLMRCVGVTIFSMFFFQIKLMLLNLMMHLFKYMQYLCKQYMYQNSKSRLIFDINITYIPIILKTPHKYIAYCITMI